MVKFFEKFSQQPSLLPDVDAGVQLGGTVLVLHYLNFPTNAKRIALLFLFLPFHPENKVANQACVGRKKCDKTGHIRALLCRLSIRNPELLSLPS